MAERPRELAREAIEIGERGSVDDQDGKVVAPGAHGLSMRCPPNISPPLPLAGPVPDGARVVTSLNGTMGIANHPGNRHLLDYLRTFAQPGTGRREADLDGWELHTHPDLIQRLAEIAGSPRALVPLFGVVAIELKDVVAVLALGTDTLLFRLPAAPTDVEMERPIDPLCDQDWYAVSAWQSELSSAEGLRRLTLLLGTARAYADEIASTAAGHPSSRRWRGRSRRA